MGCIAVICSIRESVVVDGSTLQPRAGPADFKSSSALGYPTQRNTNTKHVNNQVPYVCVPTTFGLIVRDATVWHADRGVNALKWCCKHCTFQGFKENENAASPISYLLVWKQKHVRVGHR